METAKLIDKISNQPSGISSAVAIKNLHDVTKECLLALNNIGVQTSSWDAILLHILQKKLDKDINLRFEQSLKNPKEVPTIDEFLSFLKTQFQQREVVGHKDKTT